MPVLHSNFYRGLMEQHLNISQSSMTIFSLFGLWSRFVYHFILFSRIAVPLTIKSCLTELWVVAWSGCLLVLCDCMLKTSTVRLEYHGQNFNPTLLGIFTRILSYLIVVFDNHILLISTLFCTRETFDWVVDGRHYWSIFHDLLLMYYSTG